MVDFVKQHWTYILGALLLHAVFAGIFGLTMLNMQRNAPPVQLAIQAVIVDPSPVEPGDSPAAATPRTGARTRGPAGA